MISGRQYRIVSIGGVILTTVGALLVANHRVMQALVTTYLPLVSRLDPMMLADTRLVSAIALSVAVVLCCLIPLYKPRPRRVLDTIFLAQKRIFVAMFALATVGYFNYTYRIPRTTLAMTTAALLVTLPAWFVAIRNRPSGDEALAIVIGDNMILIERAAQAVDIPVLGYLSPPIIAETEPRARETTTVADGGVFRTPSQNLTSFGGISRLKQVLVDYDVDTVILAFDNADRGEFFGVLEACHTHGVEAKVMPDHADSVLLSKQGDNLVTVNLEPWDWQDRLFKRIFDIVFAGFGLLVLAPVFALIAFVIKLDSPGPLFYSQDRTAGLGGTFPVYKFRTMLPDSESADPVDDEDNDRITRVGRVLRKSHIDELPQLWSILVGNMSVVGPRAVWTDEEQLLETQAVEWRKRWFVKPGLTGLAQINSVSSTDPIEKLQYDLEYIRQQSFWFDVKIVIRQTWVAVVDVCILLRGGDPDDETREPIQ